MLNPEILLTHHHLSQKILICPSEKNKFRCEWVRRTFQANVKLHSKRQTIVTFDLKKLSINAIIKVTLIYNGAEVVAYVS